MRLTRFQRKYLKRLATLYQRNGAVWSVAFRPLVQRMLFLGVFLGMVYWAAATLANDPLIPAGFFYAGLFTGVCAVSLGLTKQASRLWPVTSKIVDWDRVAQLLEVSEQSVLDEF